MEDQQAPDRARLDEMQEWPKRWLKSEAFWHGIVIQTMGTLAAALVIAIIAIMTGVGYTPAIRYFVLTGLFFVGVLALSSWPSWSMLDSLRRKRPEGRLTGWRYLAAVGINIVVWGLSLTTTLLVMDGLNESLAIWAGYISS